MRNAHGYSIIIDPDKPGGLQENDAVRCIHCNKIDMVRSGLNGGLEVMIFKEDGTFTVRQCGFCRSCFEPVCPRCDGKPCDNLFRRLDRDEAAVRKVLFCDMPSPPRKLILPGDTPPAAPFKLEM